MLAPLHLPKIDMNGVDQLIDGFHAVFFRDIGDMGVPGGCVEIGVAENVLDLAQAQPFLEQVGGKTMGKRVT